ncbi:MAG: glycoside hydrolase family 16 protein [Paludisphaera borealis]|uniref:glycoside hydrolase family 16 protein n=1 Tax=Paludisphaera borealis TaxID=1387353 RepID=UPI00284643ED|nr:glycoside hydrolase family 16 protein [Paludisphaera borealis]MDR3618595.1 glycoside hydrolase family 16 protein [Paludisphaera borealis]
MPLDDFEAEPRGWKFVGGEEFPGAKGSLARDASRSHGGKASYKLDADFRGGGAYVGSWKDLEPLGLPDVAEFRLSVHARNLGRLGVRIVDDTGQCHQKTVDLPNAAGEGWCEVVLKVRDLVGGEHWGGANDGAWHGPPKGLGLNIGKDAVGRDANGRATLWIDNLSAVAVAPGKPTLRSCTIDPSSCRPGYGTRLRYVWEAEPLGSNCSVFVHFVDAHGQMVFQADHDPPVPTSHWSGRVEYARTAVVPTDVAPGRYDVVVGLWNPKPSERGGGRRPFLIGTGLVALAGDACRVGSLEIAANAPLPKLPPSSLKLNDFRLTFDEDFRGPLSVSAWGPGTRWIAHTPYGGDFGDAGFADPENDSPFTTNDGVLQIEAKKVGGKWRSGLLCSVDPKGEGFSQQYGYFEMRAKLPKGLGTWPAFWLMGVPQLKEPRDKKTLTQIEIDVVEQYGVGPNALHTTLHLWGPGSFHWAEGDTSIVTGMTDDFHTYGVLVEEDFITFYFDGAELRKDKTPKEAKVPLYLMVDLALGGGWPIDRTPNPSYLLVDHVRVYARK